MVNCREILLIAKLNIVPNAVEPQFWWQYYECDNRHLRASIVKNVEHSIRSHVRLLSYCRHIQVLESHSLQKECRCQNVVVVIHSCIFIIFVFHHICLHILASEVLQAALR